MILEIGSSCEIRFSRLMLDVSIHVWFRTDASISKVKNEPSMYGECKFKIPKIVEHKKRSGDILPKSKLYSVLCIRDADTDANLTIGQKEMPKHKTICKFSDRMLIGHTCVREYCGLKSIIVSVIKNVVVIRTSRSASCVCIPGWDPQVTCALHAIILCM